MAHSMHVCLCKREGKSAQVPSVVFSYRIYANVRFLKQSWSNIVATLCQGQSTFITPAAVRHGMFSCPMQMQIPMHTWHHALYDSLLPFATAGVQENIPCLGKDWISPTDSASRPWAKFGLQLCSMFIICLELLFFFLHHSGECA